MQTLAIFVSGGGTNCENIIRYFQGSASVRVGLVVSSSASAYALVRAARLGVPSVVLSRAELDDPVRMLGVLDSYGIDFIVLAGYLRVIPDFLLAAYPRRIVNIHPSLLPKYGGKGMYGAHVHAAVKAAGDPESGITIHYVDARVDGGEILFQARTPLSPDDTPEDIAARVHRLEMEHYPRVIEAVIAGKESPAETGTAPPIPS